MNPKTERQFEHMLEFARRVQLTQMIKNLESILSDEK